MSDEALRQHIIDELDFEPSIDTAHIGVLVENGVVTLSGHVPSYWQKAAVEHAVWRVRGVKAIAEEIEVVFPEDKKRSDNQIAERAVKLLEWDVMVPHHLLRVKVQHGIVTLEGEVPWQFERRAAEEDVRKLTGVVAVINSIIVKPEIQPKNVRQRIEDALIRCAEIQAGQIRIDVRENGLVVLEGKVDSWEELQAVERAAWSAPGVSMVEDRITIN